MGGGADAKIIDRMRNIANIVDSDTAAKFDLSMMKVLKFWKLKFLMK